MAIVKPIYRAFTASLMISIASPAWSTDHWAQRVPSLAAFNPRSAGYDQLFASCARAIRQNVAATAFSEIYQDRTRLATEWHHIIEHAGDFAAIQNIRERSRAVTQIMTAHGLELECEGRDGANEVRLWAIDQNDRRDRLF